MTLIVMPKLQTDVLKSKDLSYVKWLKMYTANFIMKQQKQGHKVPWAIASPKENE